jgi:hypothetical protein
MEYTMQKATDEHTTIAAQADRLTQLSAQACPAVGIMKQMCGLDDAYLELAEHFGGTTNTDMTEIWEAKKTLRDLASLTRAKSLQGALFQMGLAREAFDEIIDAEHGTDTTGAEQRFVRLMYSAAGVIREIIGDEGVKGTCVNGGGSLYGLNPRHDPLRRIEAAAANQPILNLVVPGLAEAPAAPV